MTRPSRTGGKTDEAKARNTSTAKGGTKTKPRIAPAATRVKRRSISDPSKDLKEAREQQAATAEILEVIASSPDDVQPVFEAIAARSNQLVGGLSAMVGTIADETLHLRAFTLVSPKADAALKSMFPFPLSEFPWRDVILRGVPFAIKDIEAADPLPPLAVREMARLRGYRSMLFVPLMRDGKATGMISVTRERPGAFADHHVKLLRTFADQAVIAIENVRLFNETREALERQTATADILKVIASSPSDVQPVFEAIVGSAKRLLSGHGASLYRIVDGMLHLEAFTPFNPEADEVLRMSFPVTSSDYPPLALVARGASFQFADTEKDAPEFQTRIARLRGFRSILLTPLIHNGTTTGLVMVTRAETGSFADNHVRLMKTFADQAVIAIENARLFNETQEALERQTATAEILKVIASSPSDVRPVFEAIVNSAARLFEPCTATIITLRDDKLNWEAQAAVRSDRDFSGARAIFPIPFDPDRSASARAIQERRIIEIPDTEAADTPEFVRSASTAGGFRNGTYVPLVHYDKGIGVIILTHPQAGFRLSEKQLALVQTFADQAVIAIENTRLFDEVQAKTRDLSESLQQQTATAEVLKVISRSAFDLQTVLNTLVESAADLIGATNCTLCVRQGEIYPFRAMLHAETEWGSFLRANPARPGRQSISGRVLLSGDVEAICDVQEDSEYLLDYRLEGYRSLLGVPLLRDGKVEGVFTISRPVVGEFTAGQVDLARTFADQAMIAIENARLFNETTQALEQQTATADILKVIASSPDDVQPVFQAIAERSNRIVEGLSTAVVRLVDDVLHLMAFTPVSPEADAALQAFYPQPLAAMQMGDRTRRGEIVHIADSEVDFPTQPAARDLARKRGWRSLLFVPLLREHLPIGMISVTRVQPGGFADHHVQLLQTFADQAVIAISNVELFQQVQERTRELSASLDDLRSAQDRLIQTEKLASLGQLTAGIAHEIKNPLNFVNNFSALTAELTDELNDLLKPAPLDDKMRGEADELTGMIKDNLQKVVQHGKRADSIVKNMLLHSREGSREHRPADINSLLDESLNLAYHGARAEKGEFNITLQRDFDADAGTIELFPQEITRAFLNLIANGVYAATRRKTEEKEPGFEPTLRATTKNLGTTVEIRIRDNGTGIPAEVREKMFNPFFTTKPAGEGTGLGLSMTHDIIVKQHGGKIDVETEPGQFAEFIITLPRTIIPPKTAGGTN